MCSKWDISYSTEDYRRLGRMEDLAYKVTTSEGIKCKFTPTEKGLHVLKIDQKTNSCFFGRKIPNNRINFGMAMCYAIISETIDERIKSKGRHLNATGILRSISYENNE